MEHVREGRGRYVMHVRKREVCERKACECVRKEKKEGEMCM